MPDSGDSREHMSPLLTLADAAEFLGVAGSTVRALIQRGELVAFQVGARKQWRIEAADLEAYKNRQKAKAAEAITVRAADKVAQCGKMGENESSD